MKKLFAFVMAGAFLLLGSQALSTASAATIKINATDGTWSDATFTGSGCNPVINNSNATNTVRWGDGNGPGCGNQSGYNYTPVSAPFDATVGTNVLFGTFEHLNFPIDGDNAELTSVKLNFGMDINGPTPLHSEVYLFSHNETPNTGSGNCCNDVVTIGGGAPAFTFTYTDGKVYSFDLIGFSTNGGNTVTATFSTEEGKKNTAGIYGTFREVNQVPEPTSLLLLGSGLLAIGFGIRQRKN